MAAPYQMVEAAPLSTRATLLIARPDLRAVVGSGRLAVFTEGLQVYGFPGRAGGLYGG